MVHHYAQGMPMLSIFGGTPPRFGLHPHAAYTLDLENCKWEKVTLHPNDQTRLTYGMTPVAQAS